MQPETNVKFHCPPLMSSYHVIRAAVKIPKLALCKIQIRGETEGRASGRARADLQNSKDWRVRRLMGYYGTFAYLLIL